jgi:hypothetical protein
MTISPLIAPHTAPVASTPSTPSALANGEPTTMVEARQLASTITMPTDRSMPAVSTTSVWAMATIARSTPLLAAVVATLALRPAGWLAA